MPFFWGDSPFIVALKKLYIIQYFYICRSNLYPMIYDIYISHCREANLSHQANILIFPLILYPHLYPTRFRPKSLAVISHKFRHLEYNANGSHYSPTVFALRFFNFLMIPGKIPKLSQDLDSPIFLVIFPPRDVFFQWCTLTITCTPL